MPGNIQTISTHPSTSVPLRWRRRHLSSRRCASLLHSSDPDSALQLHQLDALLALLLHSLLPDLALNSLNFRVPNCISLNLIPLALMFPKLLDFSLPYPTLFHSFHSRVFDRVGLDVLHVAFVAAKGSDVNYAGLALIENSSCSSHCFILLFVDQSLDLCWWHDVPQVPRHVDSLDLCIPSLRLSFWPGCKLRRR